VKRRGAEDEPAASEDEFKAFEDRLPSEEDELSSSEEEVNLFFSETAPLVAPFSSAAQADAICFFTR
jgi:hypothetical protein